MQVAPLRRAACREDVASAAGLCRARPPTTAMAAPPARMPFSEVTLDLLTPATAGGAPPGEAPPLALTNFIGGVAVPAASGATIPDFNPATGRVVATIPRSGAADVDAAVAAAAAAFPAWAATPVAVRAALLDRIADGLGAHLDALAAMESQDCGKTLGMARTVDIPRAVANFRFFAGAVRHDATAACVMHDAVNYATRAPLGVAGLISPWNLPLYLLSWKVAPALACGNTVVAKPSEVTPRTASALAAIAHAAGLPPGVLNVVHGLGGEAGAALVAHPGVPLVSFTGGTVTGRAVALAAAPLFKKVSLELGGKNATIVFADVAGDRGWVSGGAGGGGVGHASAGAGMTLAKAVAGAVRSAFTNNGQVCLCGSRLLVQRSVYDAFLPLFLEAVSKLRCGPPDAPGTDVGPLSSDVHRAKVESYIELAKSEGGTVHSWPRPIADGDAQFAGGYFVHPTVITGLDHATSRTAREEIFGPVVTVHPFDGEDDAVGMANDSPYGLAGSVWTNDLTLAHRVTRRIKSGLLWVNCWLHRDLRTPFGGVKASGLGREGGQYSLDFYSEYKNVCIMTGPPEVDAE